MTRHYPFRAGGGRVCVDDAPPPTSKRGSGVSSTLEVDHRPLPRGSGGCGAWSTRVGQWRQPRPLACRNQGRASGPIIIPGVIRHLLAPHVPRAAAALDVARTLPGAAGGALTLEGGPDARASAAL